MVVVPETSSTYRKHHATWLNHLIYPFLAGFLFDLPWFNQLLISMFLVGAVSIVHDFGEAVLLLWQALVVTAFSLLLFQMFFDPLINTFLLATCVLIVWFIFLIYHSRKYRHSPSGMRLRFGSEGVLIFLYIYFISSRGRLQNLGFIYQEDNQRSMNAIVRALRSGSSDLSLLSIGDTLGMPYFIKFFVSFILEIGGLSTDAIPLRSINVLSNGWMFVLLSYLVFGSCLSKWLFSRLNNYKNVIGMSFCLLSMIWGFQISHSAGYFPLFLLNTVVVAMVLAFRVVKFESIIDRPLLLLVAVSYCFAMFGSWLPWLPAAIGMLLVVLYKFLGRRFLWKITLKPVVRILCALLFCMVFVKFLSALSKVDLESSGRDHFPLEVLILIFGLFIVMTFAILKSNNVCWSSIQRDDRQSFESIFIVGLAGFVLILAYSIDLGINQRQTLFFIIVIGLIFNRDNIRDLVGSLRTLLNREVYDAPIIFGFVSFCYISVVYVLSRFIGPTYEPMYASDKASVAFYSQFFWLPVVLITSPIALGNMKKSLSRIVSIFCFCGLLSIPSVITYKAVQENWWHRPVTDSLALDPDLPIVCSFNTEFSEDKETWVCTHFMEVLNDEKFIDLLWFQQWQSIGPRPVDLSLARKYLIDESNFKRMLVLSCSELDGGMKEFFESGVKNRFEFMVKGPCDI